MSAARIVPKNKPHLHRHKGKWRCVVVSKSGKVGAASAVCPVWAYAHALANAGINYRA